jgi:hypothetical protein
MAFQVEGRALDWYERETGQQLQRYVRFARNGKIIELDGVHQRADHMPDIVVEVKWFRIPRTLTLPGIVRQLSLLSRKYKEITRRECTLLVILVTPRKNEEETKVSEHLRGLLHADGVSSQIVVVGYEELGIEQEDGQS